MHFNQIKISQQFPFEITHNTRYFYPTKLIFE